jgi:hypothetical protein
MWGRENMQSVACSQSLESLSEPLSLMNSLLVGARTVGTFAITCELKLLLFFDTVFCFFDGPPCMSSPKCSVDRLVPLSHQTFLNFTTTCPDATCFSCSSAWLLISCLVRQVHLQVPVLRALRSVQMSLVAVILCGLVIAPRDSCQPVSLTPWSLTILMSYCA